MEPLRTCRARPNRIGLRGFLGLAAATLLLVQGVAAISESHRMHADAPCVCATSGTESPVADASRSSLAWWDAVLEGDEEPADPLAPTWWDILLCESDADCGVTADFARLGNDKSP